MRNHARGYTIIELIVSISIIGIMLGIVGAVFSLGRPFDTMKGDTDRLISVLANVRNRAFNSAQFRSVNSFCSLNPATGCTTNTDCINANKGHCTQLRYPPLGYGVHIRRDVTARRTAFTIFADLGNADGDLPFYDDAERVETATATTDFILRANTAITEAEIIFNHGSSTVTIYEKNGGAWSMVDFSGPNQPYEIRIEDFGTTPGCVKGKRGTVTVESRAMRIFGGLANCP